MLAKRLIACFDIIGPNVTKAYKFQDNVVIDNAITLADKVYQTQIDEIIFYDIMASAQKRLVDLSMVSQVAEHIFVPFTVGGGIKNINDMFAVLKAGAEKISVDSMAVRDPDIITQGAKAFGSQCIVLSMQVKKVGVRPEIPSGYEIAIDGARKMTGIDALEWAMRGEHLGAGELCVNSIDNDGTHQGYDLEITKLIAENVSIPVIASGGCGKIEHLADVFTETEASAAIISSLLYSNTIEQNYTATEVKRELMEQGIHVRPVY